MIVSGVPRGISRDSRTIVAVHHPDAAVRDRAGKDLGRFVPWMPMKPPPGQSVSTAERAFVPNATGP